MCSPCTSTRIAKLSQGLQCKELASQRRLTPALRHTAATLHQEQATGHKPGCSLSSLHYCCLQLRHSAPRMRRHRSSPPSKRPWPRSKVNRRRIRHNPKGWPTRPAFFYGQIRPLIHPPIQAAAILIDMRLSWCFRFTMIPACLRSTREHPTGVSVTPCLAVPSCELVAWP